jgi:preprotein translocase subunit SecE
MSNTDKKEAKKAKAVRKTKTEKDHWFSWSGIRKEAKRVRWPHLKSEGANNPGIVQNSGETIIFTAFFAVFFVLCDLLVTWLLTFVA